MTVLKQVVLATAREPIQISIPKGFAGNRANPEIDEIFVSKSPTFLTPDEIALVESFLEKLPYRQSLQYTGCILLSPDDPLAFASHEFLDEIERKEGFALTRKSPAGGERSVFERVLILREGGYLGNGALALAAG